MVEGIEATQILSYSARLEFPAVQKTLNGRKQNNQTWFSVHC